MRFSKLATCAVVLACALFGAGVEARSDIHRHDHGAHQGTYEGHVGHSSPAGSTLHTAESQELFARIHEELEARNYSRPLSTSNGGVHGVDVSQWAGASTWKCVKGAGQRFAIVRGYQETCQVDPNAVHTVANAWAAGIAHVDIYLYPSWRCGYSAAQQVDQAINGMGKVPFGSLWFDIEEAGAAGANHDHTWLQAAVKQAVARIGAGRVGIYSSQYGWSVAMGSYSGFESFPIWYAHYDGSASFGDWANFAGWTHPAMKQYAGSHTICGMGVDLNWYA